MVHSHAAVAAAVLLLAGAAHGVLGQQTTSGLVVTVGGPPSGLNAQVTISGPAGFRQALTGTTTLTGLTPGVFSISAALVSSAANRIYLPSVYPSASVETAAGQTVTATVEYEALVASWQPAGPAAIPWVNDGRPGAPELGGAGELRPIAVNNANPLEMYAGSGGDGFLGPLSLSGIYKTTDGGVTWTQVNTGLTDPLVEALWLDQSSPNSVLAGTQANGLFRTTDAAADWNPSQICSAITSPIGVVTGFQQVGGILYAGSGVGLLRSIDRGNSWCMEHQTDSGVRVLAASGSAIYMGLEDGNVLARANDNGDWISAVAGQTASRISSLAAHPTNPRMCFAAPRSQAAPLYVTQDGGHTWAPITGLNTPVVQFVAFQPGNPQVIFAGSDGQLFQSTDGGVSWPAAPGTSWDIRSIYPDSAGVAGRVILGSDQGVYLSRDNGTTWSSLNGNLTSSILYTVAVQGTTILTSAQDYPGLASFDGGKSWRQIPGTPETGEVLIHPADSSYAYFYTGIGFLYSVDGGKTFQQAASNGTGLHAANTRAIAVDPTTPSTIYVAGEDGIYQSTDWGKTFAITNWPIPQSPTVVAVDPSDARTIFVGNSVPNQGGTLYYTHDKGLTWAKSDFSAGVAGLLFSYGMTVAIDPLNSRNVVVGLNGWDLSRPGNGVYASTDGGKSFTQANSGIDAPTHVWNGMIQDVAFAPWYPGKVSILRGKGDGTFRPPVSYAAGKELTAVAVGDFNGDGFADVAVTDARSATVWVFQGYGDGTFRPPVSYAAGEAYAIAVVEFRAQGKPDIVIGTRNGVAVLRNNGHGTFEYPVHYTLPTGYVNSLAIGDLNNDGVPDVVATYQGGVAIFLGSANGLLSPQRLKYIGGVYTQSVAAADLNGDGKLDLAVANNESNNVSILINTTP